MPPQHSNRNDPEPQPSRASQQALSWLNFFVADIQTGFGPFLALYLASQHWSQAEIGWLLSAGGLAGIAAQIPGGALVDWAGAKRLLIGLALLAIAIGAVIFALFSNPALVFAAELLHGSTSGILKPAMAAIGLGLVGHRALGRRLGRNYLYDSLGNALTAAILGAVGQIVSKRAIFLVGAAVCVPAGWALSRIRGAEIDYARARSARRRDRAREATRPRELLKNRGLLVFGAGLTLLQFANASVMPLAAGRLGRGNVSESALVTSALVVVPQLVAAAIAAWAALGAGDRQRKPLLLTGFGTVPLHAALFALPLGPWYLVAVQVLDGVTAAFIGIMTPLVIADLTRGSGRYNLAQGAVGLTTGIGASVSMLVSGYVSQLLGFDAAFLFFAGIGLLGFGGIAWLLPETQPEDQRRN